MYRNLLPAVVVSLLTLAPHAFAADSDAHRLTIELTSSASVGRCEATVVRTVKVCDANDQCQRTALDEELTFSVPEGGSFTVTASVSYVQDGVIHGDATVDRFGAVSGGERWVQVLKTGASCSQSWSYELRAE